MLGLAASQPERKPLHITDPTQPDRPRVIVMLFRITDPTNVTDATQPDRPRVIVLLFRITGATAATCSSRAGAPISACLSMSSAPAHARCRCSQPSAGQRPAQALHVAMQFCETFFLRHFPLRNLLAHFLHAHLPLVTRQFRDAPPPSVELAQTTCASVTRCHAILQDLLLTASSFAKLVGALFACPLATRVETV